MGTAFPFCKEEGLNILVVEGKDDCNGIYHFAARTKLTGRFGIWAGDNDHQALAKFGGLLAATPSARPRIVGLVLDCDTSEHTDGSPLTRRWQQVQYRLDNSGYSIPANPDPHGTVLVSTDPAMPRVGVWIMPDNCSEGMFEDFLLRLVSPNARAYAESVVDEAKVQGHADFNNLHRSKAIAHTLLAWKDEPGRPIGIAMRMGVFDVDSELGSAFKTWLDALFVPG